MSTEPVQIADAPRAPAPLLQPDQMEKMFTGGLAKMGDAVPPESKEQMDSLLATSADPDADKADWANVAFLSDRYGKEPQEIAGNLDAYREDYAKQMFHVEHPVDGKEFYGLVGQHFKAMRDERVLLGEAQGKLFDAFSKGEEGWKPTFTSALAEMQGKPGFDPKRLDIYRQLAKTQWNAWEESGGHYPSVVEALADYMKMARSGPTAGPVDQNRQGELSDQNKRDVALQALQTVPDQDQEAVIGLALRGLPKEGEAPMVAKVMKAVATGAEATVKKGGQGLSDAGLQMLAPGGFFTALSRQAMRRPERKLDQAVAGTADPNTSQNWLARGVLSAAEGLPSMVAMFTPPGILLNLGAFSEEARGQFEDSGVPAEKAAILGPLAGVGLTALYTVNSQVLMGKVATTGIENYLASNLAGKTGGALVKGYAKNVLAMGSIDTATLGTITAGQQLTEPAIQAIASQLDHSIPGIKWTGKDGEWTRLASATPETLAGLVPLIVLGTGMGVLRNRAFAASTVHNETALRAVGLPEESVKAVMETKEPEQAVMVLQNEFDKRTEPNPAAVEAMNDKAPVPMPDAASKVTLAADGTYLVKDDAGHIVDQTGSAEMAAESLAGQRDESVSDGSGVATPYDEEMIAKWKEQIAQDRAPDASFPVPAGITPTGMVKMSSRIRAIDGRLLHVAGAKRIDLLLERLELGAKMGDKASASALEEWHAKEGLADQNEIIKKIVRRQGITNDADHPMAGEIRDLKENGVPKGLVNGKGANPDGLGESIKEGLVAAGVWDESHAGLSEGEALDMVKEAFGEKAEKYPPRLNVKLVEPGGGDAEVIPFETPTPDLSAEPGSMGTARGPDMHYGITNPAMARAMEWIHDMANGAVKIWRELRSLPEFGKFKELRRAFNGESQLRGMFLHGEVRKVFEAVPDMLTRRAMYRAIEAGFDKKQLQEWRDGSARNSSKQAYDAALKLTPEQIAYAKKIAAWFDAKHPQAVQAGLLEANQKRTNYVPLMVDKPYDVKGNPATYGGKLKGDFSHAITREFENSFELENATDEHGKNLGLKLKTDDIMEVMASYGAELDKVDLTRQLLKALESSKAKAADGEPLVQPVHGMLTNKPEKGSTISNPSSTVSESGVKYETLDHPAFKRWYFAGNDLEGKPVMFKGEMGLHPEIYQHMANILGRSKLQNWMDSPGGATAHLLKTSLSTVQEAQRFEKANMFSASAFHATHIVTRAAGNLVAPWELRRVTPDDPVVIRATRLGLQLFGDNAAMQAVAEGLGGGKGYNVLAKVPGVGKVVDGITKTTFHDLLPSYKLVTWEKLNAKNLKLFAKDIAAGRATEDQVGALTADQVNARFGELNYTDLGANPTFRHILSLLTLPPDFWRSNMQNYRQVAVGLTGAKSGREPAKAFVITAGVTWLVARVLNKALSDDDSYHFETPFEVHHGSRTYSFRTEVQDLERMVANPNQYLMGRLSPFGSSVLEYLAGVNWRGEKVGAADVLKETATKAIPASLKFLPGFSEADAWGTGHRATTSHFEQLLTAQGLKVGRDSPLTDAYKLADDYKKSVLKLNDKGGTYPVSKFQQLRYALEDGDEKKAKAEFAALSKDETPAKLARGFRSSIFHAWTGSRASDHDFKASLSPQDLAKVDKAEAHRQDIWEAFQKIHSSPSAEESDSSSSP